MWLQQFSFQVFYDSIDERKLFKLASTRCGLFAVFISMQASSTHMRSLCTPDWINWEVGFRSISPLLVSGIPKGIFWRMVTWIRSVVILVIYWLRHGAISPPPHPSLPYVQVTQMVTDHINGWVHLCCVQVIVQVNPKWKSKKYIITK